MAFMATTTSASKLAVEIAEAVKKKFGKESALVLGEGGSRSDVREVIPTGVEVIDRYVLGCGGFPVGRITELYSGEGAGKTSLLLAAIASAQRQGGLAVLAETEHALDTKRATTFGVNLDQVVLLQPNHIEGMMEQAEAVLLSLKADVPVLFGWDSIAATPPKSELEEGLVGDAVIGERARLLSRACRVLPGAAKGKRVAFVFINQTRDKIGGFGADHTTTPGGNAVKFLASIRLSLLGGAAVKDGAIHVAKDITVMTVKNKLTPPFRKARVRLNYTTGFDNRWSTISHAKDEEVIAEDSKTTDNTYAEALKKLGWDDLVPKVMPKDKR